MSRLCHGPRYCVIRTVADSVTVTGIVTSTITDINTGTGTVMETVLSPAFGSRLYLLPNA